MGELILEIVTPNEKYGGLSCDSVHLTVSDGADGKGGGSYGIRKGHVKSLISLDKGKITAYLSGEKVLEAQCSQGFATVEKNTVTVITESFWEV